MIGLLFGSGGNDATQFTDAKGDGTTNPASSTAGQPGFSVWGQAQSAHADDDGGYLRLGSAAYCAAGRYPLPATTSAELGLPLALLPLLGLGLVFGWRRISRA